ncbi:MAG: ThuA domain-containing protein [Lentisphaeria bacterium]|nr:ThuA domain-containing protein [Lentisphaeria bacterium]
MSKIKVTIWNENVHEQEQNALGDYIRQSYPNGIHQCLKENLTADDLEIRTATLDMPEQGLPDALLNDTDVLVWWGHCAHARVEDELVEKIRTRVTCGMGLLVLHSGHYSKIFKRLMGTSCGLRWREIGEKERLWVVDASHPIAKGVPETFTLPHTEMYGEPFDIPDDGKVIFMSWYEGGNVFRSGVAFQRDAGKVFYFSPGHETYPIYKDENVIKVIGNAIRWANPQQPILKDRLATNQAVPLEKVTTENPMEKIDTSALHEKQ